MCGRFALTQTPNTVQDWFDYEDRPNFPPRYNIAPTQPVAVVCMQERRRRFVLMRWGFIPGFVKDPADFPLLINARAETAPEKPSFRAAWRHRRAVIPADAFYEWQRIGNARQPFMIRRPDQGLFAFAALWETYSSRDGSEIDTVAIMTTHANGTLAGIHDRCPVVIPQAELERWLDPYTDARELTPMLRPPPDDFFELVRIGPAVNKVVNDEAAIQEPLTGPAPVPPAPRGPAQGSLF